LEHTNLHTIILVNKKVLKRLYNAVIY